MTLSDRVALGIARVGEEIKAIRAEMAALPTGGGGGAVNSVNGQTGVVVLDADDIGDGTGKVIMTATERTKLSSAVTGFADPNVDRIVFWDDSAGTYAGLAASTGLTISGTNMTVQAGSETQTGILQLASPADAAIGTNGTRAVHSSGLRAALNTIHPLTDGTAVSWNPTLLANINRWTVTGDGRVLTPTAAGYDGQRVLFQITASGADRTVTFATGSANRFAFGTDIPAIPTILSGKSAYVSCIFSSAAARWHVLTVASGY